MGIKQSSLQARNTLKSQKCRMFTHYLIILHTEKLQQKYTGSICVHITHIHTRACAHTHTFIAPQYSYTEENSGNSKSTDYNDYVSRVDKDYTEKSFGHCGE